MNTLTNEVGFNVIQDLLANSPGVFCVQKEDHKKKTRKRNKRTQTKQTKRGKGKDQVQVTISKTTLDEPIPLVKLLSPSPDGQSGPSTSDHVWQAMRATLSDTRASISGFTWNILAKGHGDKKRRRNS